MKKKSSGIKISLIIIVVWVVLLIAVYYLWKPARIYYFTYKIKSQNQSERIDAMKGLLSFGEKGKLEIVKYLKKIMEKSEGHEKVQVIDDIFTIEGNDRFSILLQLFDNREDAARLIDVGWNNINEHVYKSRTPLIYTASNYNLEDIAELFILKGADINKHCPLHSAAYQRNYRMVKLLVMQKAKINLKDTIDFTPLDYALLKPDICLLDEREEEKNKIVKFLKENGGKTSKELDKEGTRE